MASASFRDSLNSMGWSRRDPDLPVRTNSATPFLSKIQSYNPFNSASGSVHLPTDENPGAPLPARNSRDEEEAWFALSRWDRLLLFGGLLAAAVVLFIISFFAMPAIVLVGPRKFVILWSMGSVLFLAAWAVMMGPMAYVRHLISGPRLPFTAAYFGSIAMTLVSAIHLKNTLLTLIFALVQVGALVTFTVSYFPMGMNGLRFATSVGSNQVAAWMRG